MANALEAIQSIAYRNGIRITIGPPTPPTPTTDVAGLWLELSAAPLPATFALVNTLGTAICDTATTACTILFSAITTATVVTQIEEIGATTPGLAATVATIRGLANNVTNAAQTSAPSADLAGLQSPLQQAILNSQGATNATNAVTTLVDSSATSFDLVSANANSATAQGQLTTAIAALALLQVQLDPIVPPITNVKNGGITAQATAAELGALRAAIVAKSGATAIATLLPPAPGTTLAALTAWVAAIQVV